MINPLSDRQPEREELARNLAVEARHTPDARLGNNEDDNMPTTQAVGLGPMALTPSSPQIPAGEHGKSYLNPRARGSLRH